MMVPSSNWHFLQMTFNKEVNKKTEISLIGKVNGRGHSAIVDDIEFHGGKCHETPEERTQLYYCSMKPEANCGLLYLDDNGSANDDKINRSFQTPNIHPREPSCVNIAYQTRFEPENGDASLTIDTVHDGSHDQLLAETESRFGFWHHRRWTVDHPGSWSIQVKLNKAEAGSDAVSEMDINEISIVRGECPPMTACDFSRDQCGWQSLTELVTPGLVLHSAIEWTRHHANSWEATDVPSRDSDGLDTDSSHFMLASGSSGNANLMSPIFQWPENVTTACFTFFEAKSAGGDLVAIKFDNLTTKSDSSFPLIVDKETPPTQWTKMQIQLTRDSPETMTLFYLNLRAKLESDQDFVAVDDFLINFNESCKSDEVYPWQRWSCATGWQSIYAKQRCDFKYDCRDKSDEQECGHSCTVSD